MVSPGCQRSASDRDRVKFTGLKVARQSLLRRVVSGLAVQPEVAGLIAAQFQVKPAERST
jgi:hypothetical protein